MDIAGRKNRSGTEMGVVPCHEEFPVQTWELAHLLLVSAFWGLQEAGLVRLNIERKVLFYISRHAYVKVTLLEGAGLSGLEGQLLATMHQNPYSGQLNTRIRQKTLERLEDRDKGEVANQLRQRADEQQLRREQHLYVERVVPHWFGGHFKRPAMHVLDAMRDIAVSFGYVDAVDAEGRGLLGVKSSKTEYRPRCDTIASLQRPFEETVDRWNKFRKHESDLFEQLSQQCRQGMRNALTGGRS
jgi:hypothetical protein